MKTTLVIVILSVFAGLAVSGMTQNSGTCDEIAHHIPAAYSYYKKWDFRLNPSNPPLSRYIMALPLNFLNLEAPFEDKSWRDADSPSFGKKFLFAYNSERAGLILFLSRLAIVFVGIFAGLLVYLFTSKLYGKNAGIFALILFSLTPEILAHSSLATTDMTFACFSLLAIYELWKYMKTPDKKGVFKSGVSLGLAQLSKYSALALYPIFLVLMAVWFFSKRHICFKNLKGMLAVFVISVIVIWAGYGFEMRPFLSNTIKANERISFVQNLASRSIPFWNNRMSVKAEYILKNTPLPLTTYITGIFGVMKHDKEGHRTFFMGRWSDFGTPFYYVVALLIKTPIPIIVFIFLAFLSTIWRRLREDEAFLLVPAAFILVTASMGKLQLGIRYILPVYLLSIVFSSRIIPLARKIWQKLILCVLVVWLIIINFLAWPHYLSYFNGIIGGPDNGWKYLRDSNIDWGQDLPSLSSHMKKDDIASVKLLYFGEADPGYYEISYQPISDEERMSPANYVYAISANYIDAVKWKDSIRPTAKAGYSIFIYDLRKEKL